MATNRARPSVTSVLGVLAMSHDAGDNLDNDDDSHQDHCEIANTATPSILRDRVILATSPDTHQFQAPLGRHCQDRVGGRARSQ